MAQERVNVLAQEIADRYALYHADSIEAIRAIPEHAIDLTVSSPPFAALYVYQATDRDVGNARDEAEFFRHYDFLIREMLRVTAPGRCAAIHCMDIPAMLSRDGYIGLKDFSGDLIRAFIAAGWIWDSRIPIDKNQQLQGIRTHAKALTMTQFEKDRSWMRPALPDYILKFRKPGENANPVRDHMTRDEWILWANPTWPCPEDRCAESGAFATWEGIQESDTLQGWMGHRVSDDERHICPLQRETVRRCIRLWTNPDEVVFDPFDGIGTVVHEAIGLGRRGVGIELKANWYGASRRYAADAAGVAGMGDLFASAGIEVTP